MLGYYLYFDTDRLGFQNWMCEYGKVAEADVEVCAHFFSEWCQTCRQLQLHEVPMRAQLLPLGTGAGRSDSHTDQFASCKASRVESNRPSPDSARADAGSSTSAMIAPVEVLNDSGSVGRGCMEQMANEREATGVPATFFSQTTRRPA